MFKSSSWNYDKLPRYRRKEGWLDQLGIPSSDRMINLRVTIDMSFRFRFALLLCAFIILVNILFKVQTDFVEKSIFKHSRAAIYHPPSKHSEDPLQNMDMNRLELDPAVAPQQAAAPKLDKTGGKLQQAKAKQMKQRNRLRHAEDSEDGDTSLDIAKFHHAVSHQEGTCKAGHIPGLGEICDSKGCLRRLKAPSGGARPSGRQTLSEQDRRHIDYLPGWLDSTHYDIIPLVTDIQWTEDVYGSVGEIIAGVGKLTSLLSYNVDQSVGELLFVSDDFIGDKQQPGVDSDQSTYESFVENISHCGYTVTDITSEKHMKTPAKNTKTVYVHKGNIMDLDKKLFLHWDIPQFRLLAVDGGEGSSPISLHSSLIISSCILADGGVLIVDGVDPEGPQTHAIACLIQYFSHVQGIRPVLVPLLSARNKLYLTTVGFRKKYTEHLVRYSKERLGTGLYETTTNKFGRKFTYLTLEE